jgi:hypothetical protein
MKKAWLEWPFNSQGYFQSSMETVIDGRKIIVDNEKIILELKEDDTDDKGLCTKECLDKLDIQINTCIKLLQLDANKKFELNKYSLYTSFGPNNLNVTVFPDPVYIKLKIGEVDLIITDSLGNEVSDTKKARSTQTLQLIKLYSDRGINDEVLEFMLERYNCSLSDQNIALVALYDIRDALTNKFKKEDIVKKELNISKKVWQRMGEIANELPLHQSRHSGKKLDKSLRNIEEIELNEIRAIAKIMINKYLVYLNKQDYALPK